MSAPLRTRRGRPRRFDPDEALEQAMRVFWAKGYHDTTLDDLTAAAGASRAGLYAAFGDKEAIFLAALERYVQGFEEHLGVILAGQADARRGVERALASAVERLTDPELGGRCLRVNATLECRGGDVGAAMDAKLIDANARLEGVFRRHLDCAQSQAQLPPEEDLAALARFITGTINGMVVLARGGADQAALTSFAAIAMRAWPRSS